MHLQDALPEVCPVYCGHAPAVYTVARFIGV